ncbi:MAG: hypothetical protein EXS03_09670 [Phycisphaerales bacterium]|nr:hypothetical protein [Phycisphaerales bacterium]
MWQMAIVATIVFIFKAIAAHQAKVKRDAEAAGVTKVPKPRQTPSIRAIPIEPLRRGTAGPLPPTPRLMREPRAAPLFAAVVEALRSHSPSHTSELRVSEGEATAAQLASTVRAIREGVLQRRGETAHASHTKRPVPSVEPHGKAPVRIRQRILRKELRRAVVLAEVLGRPRSLATPY